MAINSNMLSQQTPMTPAGRTGVQVVKFIPGCRVFIKATDATAAPPVAKADGSVPSGWTDLGIVDGNAKLSYNKETKEVRTGQDEVLRAAYVGKKTGSIEFDLSQFDDVVTEQLTGLTPSITTSGSIVHYGVGNEDVVIKALLVIMQNKLDKKEMQIYHPAAYINFSIAESGDTVVFKGNAFLPLFTWNSLDGNVYVQSFFK